LSYYFNFLSDRIILTNTLHKDLSAFLSACTEFWHLCSAYAQFLYGSWSIRKLRK